MRKSFHESSGTLPNKALQLPVKGRVAIDLWYSPAPDSGAPLGLGWQPLPAVERPVRSTDLRSGVMLTVRQPERTMVPRLVYAAAAALLYGLQQVLTKLAANRIRDGVGGLEAAWQNGDASSDDA